MPPFLNLIQKQIYSTQGGQVQAPAKAELSHPKNCPQKGRPCPSRNEPRATTGIMPFQQCHWHSTEVRERVTTSPANLTKAVRKTSGNSFLKKKFQKKFNFFEVSLGRNPITASITQWVTGSKQQLLLSEVSHMQIHPVIELPPAGVCSHDKTTFQHN